MKHVLRIFILFSLTLLVGVHYSFAATVWQEDFSDSAINHKGAVGPNNTVDMNGVTKWSIDVSGADLSTSTDWFYVNNERFEGRDLDGPAIWETESIDLSSASNIAFQLDLLEVGDIEPSDYADIYYSVDGGAFTRIPNWNNLGSANHTLEGDNPDDSDWGSVTINQSLSGNPQSLVIRVIMRDDAGPEYIRIDNVLVTGDINHAPTNILIDGADSDTVEENTPLGTTVATLSTVDADAGDTHTYSLVAGVGDEDNAKFQITGTNLQLNFVPDFENPADLGDTPGNNTYSIRVETNDGHNGVYQKVFIITITNLNETPHFTSPTTITIPENQTNITTVNAEDPDQGDTITYSISGGADQTLFQIDSTTGALSFTTAPDYENPTDSNGDNTYEVSLSVTDTQGLTDNQTLSVHISDVNEQTTQRSRSHKSSRRISKQKLAQIFETKIEEPQQETKESPEENKQETCHFIYTRLIKQGMKGEDVRRLQYCMNKLGYYSGPEDGFYSHFVYDAVMHYQKAMQLHYIDGVVGPETSRKLNGNTN